MNGRKAPKTRGHAADNPYEVIHILSDINRMQILRLLAEHGELCARDILTFFPITQPTLSHHMNVLLDNHLVEARKSGRWVFYHLSQNGIQEIINFFENLKKSSSATSANLQKNTAAPAKARKSGTHISDTHVSDAHISGTRLIKETVPSEPFADKKKIPASETAVTENIPAVPSETEAPSTDKPPVSTEKYAEFFSSKKDKKKDKEKEKLSKKEKKKKKNKKK